MKYQITKNKLQINNMIKISNSKQIEASAGLLFRISYLEFICHLGFIFCDLLFCDKKHFNLKHSYFETIKYLFRSNYQYLFQLLYKHLSLLSEELFSGFGELVPGIIRVLPRFEQSFSLSRYRVQNIL